MSIRLKIVLVILPVLIASVILVGASSYFYASTGITRIARDFLDFKAEELRKYADGQWQILVENDLTGNQDMVQATQLGVEGFARSIVRSATEKILAFDGEATLVMATEPVEILEEEKEALLQVIQSGSTELHTLTLGGVERVARGFSFPQYRWFFLLTEERDTFYRDVMRITRQTAYVLIGAVLVSIILILSFSRSLIKPLRKVIDSMKSIILSNDLTERVAVEYHDETGELAHTFNIMITELEKAYSQIKSFAFKAVLAQRKESRIRNIFQKYVPQELIDRFFENPESMLVGENRVLSVLFSDIRSFTSISEKMQPDDLVSSLNHYFSVMVEIIMGRGGIIDKYIGDAIMAFFGAPVKHDDDAYQSALAGIEMTEAVKEFNNQQLKAGKPEFRIGVGINYGIVTVGNIGTEKKMDYTVIGDMVNLASRLEGLTKVYRQELLVSESIQHKIQNLLPYRLLDTVAVKGKERGVKIYTLKKELSDREDKGWKLHNQAMDLYYTRDFSRARELFNEALSYIPDDYVISLLQERIKRYLETPPPESWTGVQVMETK
ncbi:MAG: HAMP domain-containing protein [Spirochaetales bacterium]|nr:HAMP domain-containing protein [Spirochaetales bacterium]